MLKFVALVVWDIKMKFILTRAPCLIQAITVFYFVVSFHCLHLTQSLQFGKLWKSLERYRRNYSVLLLLSKSFFLHRCTSEDSTVHHQGVQLVWGGLAVWWRFSLTFRRHLGRHCGAAAKSSPAPCKQGCQSRSLLLILAREWRLMTLEMENRTTIKRTFNTRRIIGE